MRTVNNGAMRGTRVGSGPPGEPYSRGFPVARVVVLYYCERAPDDGAVHRDRDTTPAVGMPRLPQPAGTDPLDPPSLVARNMGEKTHLGHVRDRRTQAEGDLLMAESLARRDHPGEYNVWARPRRRKS